MAFLVRYFRGIFAAFSTRAELRVLEGFLPFVVAGLLVLGANLQGAGDPTAAAAPIASVGGPGHAEFVASDKMPELLLTVALRMSDGPKHLGTWLEPSEEGEEKESRSDSGAEEVQQPLALLSDPFHPLHTLNSQASWCGSVDTEPRHEWIARLERPPCVRTVAPFI